jgi:hypothetical protein
VYGTDYFRTTRSRHSKTDAEFAGSLSHGNYAHITSRYRGKNSTQDSASSFHRFTKDCHHRNLIVDLSGEQHTLRQLNAENGVDQLKHARCIGFAQDQPQRVLRGRLRRKQYFYLFLPQP